DRDPAARTGCPPPAAGPHADRHPRRRRLPGRRGGGHRPGDLWIAQDGYLAVTTPEQAASILKLGAGDIPRVATWLRLTPAELMSRGIVRGIIRPPAAAASAAGQAADPR